MKVYVVTAGNDTGGSVVLVAATRELAFAEVQSGVEAEVRLAVEEGRDMGIWRIDDRPMTVDNAWAPRLARWSRGAEYVAVHEWEVTT